MSGALPKRKQLRLPFFDYSTGAAYFITICTHQRQPLFGRIDLLSPEDAPCLFPALNQPDQLVIQFLHQLEHKYPTVSLDAYVVMPDHVHFILFQSAVSGAHAGAPLQEILKWFKTQTTNAYIRGVKDGLYLPYQQHLWQRSYYEHIIRNEMDLNETRSYIENNPASRWAKMSALRSL